MLKKLVLTFAAFSLIGACVFGAAMMTGERVGVFPIVESSPCPATECANGICHGFDDVPNPDGEHEMVCPEAGCASVECHAWSSLRDRYHQASDASLNLWVLMPAVLTAILVLVVRKVK